MPRFPKVIYVQWEPPGSRDEPYITAAEIPDGLDGERVAIYELKEVKTKKIVESLV